MKENISQIEKILTARFNLPVRLSIETHFSLLVKLTEWVNTDEQGKRYALPVLDLLRELHRHLRTNSRQKLHAVTDSIVLENLNALMGVLKVGKEDLTGLYLSSTRD